ncbi:MAG TPA: hypothetical protein VEB00_11455 [Clostridia bacterium]|nr:hypothetical protein [Clostridia bacterium]
MNIFKKFMVGRYGSDQLAVALIIFSLLITWTAELIRLPLLTLVGYVTLGVCIFRMLSKNLTKRSMENYKFNILISPAYSWFKKKQKHLIDSKTHRYFECPNCKTNLRVPKGKGDIVITCPKCKTELKKRT